MTGSEMVPVVANGLTVDPTKLLGQYWGGIDLRTPEGKLTLVRAIQGKAQSIKEVVNTELLVVNVVCHPAERIDKETGEVQQWPREVIFLADGRLIDAGSKGVLKSFAVACIVQGPPPWEPPLKVIPKIEALEGGRNWYYFDFPDLEKMVNAGSKKAKK